MSCSLTVANAGCFNSQNLNSISDCVNTYVHQRAFDGVLQGHFFSRWLHLREIICRLLLNVSGGIGDVEFSSFCQNWKNSICSKFLDSILRSRLCRVGVL